jgi:hypothetical protein
VGVWFGIDRLCLEKIEGNGLEVSQD